jgi:hypothetical protein
MAHRGKQIGLHKRKDLSPNIKSPFQLALGAHACRLPGHLDCGSHCTCQQPYHQLPALSPTRNPLAPVPHRECAHVFFFCQKIRRHQAIKPCLWQCSPKGSCSHQRPCTPLTELDCISAVETLLRLRSQTAARKQRQCKGQMLVTEPDRRQAVAWGSCLQMCCADSWKQDCRIISRHMYIQPGDQSLSVPLTAGSRTAACCSSASALTCNVGARQLHSLLSHPSELCRPGSEP